MDRLLKLFIIICACLLANTIQVCKLYRVTFFFTIDTPDEKMIVSFFMTVK